MRHTSSDLPQAQIGQNAGAQLSHSWVKITFDHASIALKPPLAGLRATADGGNIGIGIEVGLMPVGEHFDEPTIYRTVYAFEQSGDLKKM